jgi:tRNA-dihydrouridine synthase B
MKNSYTIESAPMAGYTDFAFRKVLRKCGAEVVWTEMISTTALFHGSKKTEKMLAFEGKTVVQIFGHNPDHFEAVIASGIFDKFHEININMGCPARKITSNGDGVALMKNPKLAQEIIETCVRVSKRPVSVKMRLGFAPEPHNPNVLPYHVQFALMCQTAGASRIIVHGRYGTQGYSGTADWGKIAEVVKALKIPVIANGDIRDVEHAKECIEKTGAAGVMIGRAIIGATWKISQKMASEKEIKAIIKYHLKHADNIIEMRKHLVAYADHLPNSKELKKRLAVVKSKEEAGHILQLN